MAFNLHVHRLRDSSLIFQEHALMCDRRKSFRETILISHGN